MGEPKEHSHHKGGEGAPHLEDATHKKRRRAHAQNKKTDWQPGCSLCVHTPKPPPLNVCRRGEGTLGKDRDCTAAISRTRAGRHTTRAITQARRGQPITPSSKHPQKALDDHTAQIARVALRRLSST